MTDAHVIDLASRRKPRLVDAVHNPAEARTLAQLAALDEHITKTEAERVASLNARTLMRAALIDATDALVRASERMAMIASSVPGTPQGDCAADSLRDLNCTLRRVGEMRRQAMGFEPPTPPKGVA